MTAEKVQKQLENLSTPEKKAFLPYFFKTGKGQYGEGDKFLGVVVPDIRKVAKDNNQLDGLELSRLLENEWHECRLCALIILMQRFKKANEIERKIIFDYYLSQTKYINNWDLVDITCRDIVGIYLLDKNRDILYRLADSDWLWDQRIAVISTYAFIKRDDFKDIIALSEKLMSHKHDLMQKAIGWMLRETGKRDEDVLKSFLDKYHKQMPRTMLRYSIEKLSPEERLHYMKR